MISGRWSTTVAMGKSLKQLFPHSMHAIHRNIWPQKGGVAYTLVANHVPVNADMIGAHDHESQFVFDLLFNNTTDIRLSVHSPLHPRTWPRECYVLGPERVTDRTAL